MSLFIFLGIFSSVFVAPGLSCSCVPQPEFPTPLCCSSTSYALRGTIESKMETGGNDTNAGWRIFKLKVGAIYRGKQVILNVTQRTSIPIGSNLDILARRNSPLCGVDLPLKKDYVITGYIIPEGNLTTSSCDWNREWDTLSERTRTHFKNFVNEHCLCGAASALGKRSALEWLVMAALLFCVTRYNVL